jgi:sulfur dioxygenase
VIFRQLFESESSTYTYLIADEHSREAILIDPVDTKTERDMQLLKELKLKLVYSIETHVHADHVTASSILRSLTGAKTVIGENAGVKCTDILLKDEDSLSFGSNIKLKGLATPGHTDGCMSYLVGDKLFSGDALLIRTNGRTDFQQGSAERLYQSVMTKIYALEDHISLYPAHDYNGHTQSTVGEEKLYNKRIPAHQDRDTFVKIMRELKLADPKMMAVAVPANLSCGQRIQL